MAWHGSRRSFERRNLVRIVTGDPRDDDTDHCLGVVWTEGGTLDLKALLDPVCNPYLNSLSFWLNGKKDADGVLEYGKEPKDLAPTIFHVELRHEDVHGTLDRLWVVVNGTRTDSLFSGWLLRNQDIAWTTLLPKLHGQLTISGADITYPEPESPNLWLKPRRIGSHLHHDAQFELRSIPVGVLGHGHQATYDASGTLITDSIAAGSADIFAPYTSLGFPRPGFTHRNEDVYPFIRSLQLDGNPSIPRTKAIPKNLDRPCLYMGGRIYEYMNRRPANPTGVLQ